MLNSFIYKTNQIMRTTFRNTASQILQFWDRNGIVCRGSRVLLFLSSLPLTAKQLTVRPYQLLQSTGSSACITASSSTSRSALELLALEVCHCLPVIFEPDTNVVRHQNPLQLQAPARTTEGVLKKRLLKSTLLSALIQVNQQRIVT